MLKIFFGRVLHNGFENPVEVGKTIESTIESNRRNAVHVAGC